MVHGKMEKRLHKEQNLKLENKVLLELEKSKTSKEVAHGKRITVLEDCSLFSNFGADLMKALKEVNRAFDLDCLSNKKQSTIKDFFPNFISTLIKKDKERKRTCCFLISQSL